MREHVKRAYILAIIVSVTVVAFSGVIENNFINYDDPGYVTKNENVRSGLSVKTILWAFKSTVEANWHPLTWISHALDCTLFGLNAGCHHASNLFYHILGSIVLFIALEKMTKSMWQSAFVALVFAVHPLHVESVAWIAERKDVLSGLLWMLTIAAYAHYCKTSDVRWYYATIALFAAGLTAKPMVITLPFVLVLMDYWPLNRISGKDKKGISFIMSVREKIPLLCLSLLSAIITYIVQQRGGSMASSDVLPLTWRLENAVISYAKYIRSTLLPSDLAIFYPHPGQNTGIWHFGAAAAVLAFLTLGAWKMRKRFPYLPVGWFWFTGTLIPVIGIVQVGLQAMADRYMYLPIIGLSIMIAWGIPALLRRMPNKGYVMTAAFALTVAVMVLQTRAQVGRWKNGETLFGHAIAVTKDNHLAHNNLGKDLADSGRHAEAVEHLREAVRIRPGEILIHANLARSLTAKGEFDEALHHYLWILDRVPSDPALHWKVGDILSDRGRIEEAIYHYKKVVRLKPDDVFARCKLGELYSEQSKFDEAKEECRHALKLDSCSSKAHDVLGIIAGRERKYDEALAEFGEAIRCDSTNADAYNNLAILYDRMGKPAEAVEYYRTAVRFNPDHVSANSNLGTALARAGDFKGAEFHWMRAVSLNPRHTDARANLGRLFATQERFEDAAMQYSEALRTDPDNVIVHYHYGNLLAIRSKYTEAEAHYADAIRLAPGFKAPREALKKIREMKKNVSGASESVPLDRSGKGGPR